MLVGRGPRSKVGRKRQLTPFGMHFRFSQNETRNDIFDAFILYKSIHNS